VIRWIRKSRARTNAAYLCFALACAALVEGDVSGFGMAQVIEAKSLPQATVAVIDPESGTSSGTGSLFGVKLEVGDIILFRFAFTPVPDKRNRGIQSYITEYLPPNTEVVGVRIIDSNGFTIEPRHPGLAIDGCSGGSKCNNFNNLACSAGAGCAGGQVDLASGSVAQVHADTGAFFVPRSDARSVERTPDDVFLTPTNGIQMNPAPSNIDPTLTPLLEVTAPYFAHNDWDQAQVKAYGIATDAANTAGDGDTPFGYGSPVAGPQTFYGFEATDIDATAGTTIRFNDVVGPWRRIVTPGAKIGTGVAGGTGQFTRAIRDPAGAEIGTDVTPANSVSAQAVRWALGDTRTGRPQFVEVALRVTGIPLDPNFLGGPGEHVNCGEVFGTDLAQRKTGSNNDGENHPWATYIGSPACVFLRLKLDITGPTESSRSAPRFPTPWPARTSRSIPRPESRSTRNSRPTASATSPALPTRPPTPTRRRSVLPGWTRRRAVSAGPWARSLLRRSSRSRRRSCPVDPATPPAT
jgi:hypothetical protein